MALASLNGKENLFSEVENDLREMNDPTDEELFDIQIEADEVRYMPQQPTALGLYSYELSRIPLLTADEEKEVAKAIEEANKTGDFSRALELRNRFVEHNLRLPFYIAGKNKSRLLDLDDKIQSGNLGLIRAAEKFDYRRGFKFSTPAFWWVRQAIGRAIINQGRIIRIPADIDEGLTRMGTRLYEESAQELGRLPTVDELIATTSENHDLVLKALQVSVRPMSLEAPVREDEDFTLKDTIEDKSKLALDVIAERQDLREAIEEILSREFFKPREKLVIILSFGLRPGSDSMTLAEIGREMHLSRERIRQIRVDALAKLRTPKVMEELKPYLE